MHSAWLHWIAKDWGYTCKLPEKNPTAISDPYLIAKAPEIFSSTRNEHMDGQTIEQANNEQMTEQME